MLKLANLNKCKFFLRSRRIDLKNNVSEQYDNLKDPIKNKDVKLAMLLFKNVS